MPTKTPREIELEEKIYELSRLIETSAEWWHTFNHDVYLPALKTLLEEARQEEREKLATFIRENRNTVTLVQIEDFISSLIHYGNIGL